MRDKEFFALKKSVNKLHELGVDNMSDSQYSRYRRLSRKLIRFHNDLLRTTLMPCFGEVRETLGVRQLSKKDRQNIYSLVSSFNSFNKSNDPYNEHDFAFIDTRHGRIFFKIDYKCHDSDFHSPRPYCNKSTKRVLTIGFHWEN